MASSSVLLTNPRSVNIVTDEKFEELHRPDEYAIRIADNGNVCEKVKPGTYGSALGSNSYSSGVHQIRIKLNHGNALLGIRSRNIVPMPYFLDLPKYDDTPSTYGWWMQNALRRNNGIIQHSNLAQIKKDNIVFTITVNCNEHRLGIATEDNNEKGEMEIDRLHAPFPWCLFVVLPRTIGRVSLV